MSLACCVVRFCLRVVFVLLVETPIVLHALLGWRWELDGFVYIASSSYVVFSLPFC